MKLVTAIIKPHRLDEVKTALKATGSVPRPDSLASQVTPLAEAADAGDRAVLRIDRRRPCRP